MPAASSGAGGAGTGLSGNEELPEIAKVFCKRCGASAKPFSRYCETCGNTLDLSKESRPNKSAEGEAEKTVITGKLLTPPAAAAFRTQADSPTGRLQASLSELSQRLSEPLLDIDRGGRKTANIDKSLAEDFSGATDPLIGRTTDPGLDPPGMDLRMDVLADAVSIESEQAVRRSDSRSGTVALIIVVTLAVGAGLVAFQLWRNGPKSRASSAEVAVDQSPDPSTSKNSTTSALPGDAPSPAQPAASTTPNSAPSTPPPPDGMVFVSGGTFKMGRDGGDELERPAHAVAVKPFFIDRSEVTNEEYQRFVSATGRRAPTHWAGGKIPDGQAKFPVVNVSWNDANAYARWAEKRLPTEAEWEFAARGTDGRIYPWGNNWRQDYANAAKNRNGALGEIGTYAPGASPFGALDMCGNVWEWTSSNFEDYPGRKNASSFNGSGFKVIRGGAYDVAPQRATSTYRGAIRPDRVLDKTGFRCARDAQ